MKKVISLMCLTLVACSTEIEKLESRRDSLTQKADKLTEEHIGLLFECGSIKNQLIPTIEYKLNEHKLKKAEQEVCSKAEAVHKEYLPLRFEVREIENKIEELKKAEIK